MLVTETVVEIDITPRFGQGITLPPPPPRSPGIHVSDIIRRICADTGFYKPGKVTFGRNTFEEIDEENIPACIAAGLMYEDFHATIHPEMIYHPGELCRDGIFMSPDGVTPIQSNGFRYTCTRLDEMKATWKSSYVKGAPRLIELMMPWMIQIKAYCYELEAIHAALHVMYMNGNYRFGDDPNGGPHHVRYDIVFTQWELKSNWDLVLRYRDKLLMEAAKWQTEQNVM